MERRRRCTQTFIRNLILWNIARIFPVYILRLTPFRLLSNPMLIVFPFLVEIAGKSGMLSRLVSRFELFSATLIRGRISLENSTTARGRECGIFEDSSAREAKEGKMPRCLARRAATTFDEKVENQGKEWDEERGGSCCVPYRG